MSDTIHGARQAALDRYSQLRSDLSKAVLEHERLTLEVEAAAALLRIAHRAYISALGQPSDAAGVQFAISETPAA